MSQPDPQRKDKEILKNSNKGGLPLVHTAGAVKLQEVRQYGGDKPLEQSWQLPKS